MNVLDLFSGIGGFSLGLERVGMRTVAFCECDNFCRAVLAKHWPNVPIHDDVRTLSRDIVRARVDLVCGGFPCQPFSVAGKQRGTQDDCHLWPAMFKIVSEFRPSWVVGENVTGLIPMALDQVLFDLESIGYTPRSFVIPACAVDAWHRRDRVWIVACNADKQGESTRAINDEEVAELCSPVAHTHSARVWVESRRGDGPYRKNSPQLEHHGQARIDPNTETVQRCAIKWNESHGTVRRCEDVAKSSRNGRKSWRQSDAKKVAERRQSHRGCLSGNVSNTNRESLGRSAIARRERCQWKPEPNVGRVAHGIPRRVDRLRCLGNAVVPQVVEEIGLAIMRASGV